MNFKIEPFERLPQGLSPSAYVDFFLFIAGLKPSLRIFINDLNLINQINQWCNENSVFFLSNKDGYVCIAKNRDEVKILQATDDSIQPHEYKLGLLLGYPSCCCKKIAKIGEKNIDNWESLLIKKSTFKGQFKLIDIAGYRNGSSLISHIPCSTECEKSLYIAKKSLAIISNYRRNHHFNQWQCWLKYD
jgi:hypothetical protein